MNQVEILDDIVFISLRANATEEAISLNVFTLATDK